MADRNFRSYYYEKVGFRVVEEKKSFEILLKDRPLDKTKLAQFALRFPVPAIHRMLLWKILLDILPVYLDQHEFVSLQRKEQCEDLSSTLRVLQTNTNNQKSHIFLYMRALEMGRLKLNYQQEAVSQEGQIFLRICEALSDIVASDADTYWLAKKFCLLLKSFKPTFPALISYTEKMLMKQDETLYKYIVQKNFFEALPLERWLEKCFANILPIIALQRIWDKVMGGSSIIMVFLLISIFTRLKQTILKMESPQTLVEFIRTTSPEVADLIVTEAIEMWQGNGSPLTAGSNTDCFKDQSQKQGQGHSVAIKSGRNFNQIHPRSMTIS